MITIGVATVTTAAQAQSFVHVEKPENKGLFGILYKALGCSFSIFLVNQQPCPLPVCSTFLPSHLLWDKVHWGIEPTYSKSDIPGIPGTSLPFLPLACSLLTFLSVEKRNNNIVL